MLSWRPQAESQFAVKLKAGYILSGRHIVTAGSFFMENTALRNTYHMNRPCSSFIYQKVFRDYTANQSLFDMLINHILWLHNSQGRKNTNHREMKYTEGKQTIQCKLRVSSPTARVHIIPLHMDPGEPKRELSLILISHWHLMILMKL